jgi:type I restriction enzyme, S subunit
MAMNQTNYGIRGQDALSDFATYLLLRHAVDELRMHAYGTVFDTITRRTFEGIKTPSPPGRVWARFEAQVAPWFHDILTNQQQNVQLAATRDYLLPKLLSGEVEVGTVGAAGAVHE